MSPDIETLDLSGVPCPRNTAEALLALELMDAGDLLDVLLDDGEPLKNVPPALELEGHRVLSTTPEGSGWRLRVERGDE